MTQLSRNELIKIANYIRKKKLLKETEGLKNY